MKNKQRAMRTAIYLRCSTTDQDTAMQERELKAYVSARGWQLSGIFKDRGVSGAKDVRPALSEMLRACKQRKYDAVVVWKFDRFARSLKQLLTALEEFK